MNKPHGIGMESPTAVASDAFTVNTNELVDQYQESPSFASASIQDCCDHCGLPSPRRSGNELTFCCSGCRGAYHLIHQWGLEDYYALRDRLVDRGTLETATRQDLTPDRWDELEAANLLGASTPVAAGEGLVCSRLAIEGIHCGACVWLIERVAMLSPGWQHARVGMHDHSLEVTFDPQKTRLQEIAQQLSQLGYRVMPWVEGSGAERFRRENRERLVQVAIAGFCAMNAMWLAVGIYAGEYSGIAYSHLTLLRAVGVGLGMVSVFGPGRTFFRGAWAAIKTRTPHMDLPIALGIGVGAIAGAVSLMVHHQDVYFDSVAVLVFLLLVGRWIQFRQQHRAADAVSLLMRMTPALATKIDGQGNHLKVSAGSIQVGDHVYVISGEMMPVDGEIVCGETLIDRSLMTGESMPVQRSVGETVEAGTLNIQSPITLIATSSRSDSRLTKLMKLVEEASLRRTPIVQLADAIASRFVVILIILAVATMIVWSQWDMMRAASNTVALLIVACPCALALATPLAIAVALGRAAKRKLLIRSGETLESLATPGKIWFDKTGTLTAGKPQVISHTLSDRDLALCASLEAASSHPLARAIVDAASGNGLRLLDLSDVVDVHQVSGQGIRGRVAKHHVSIGNLDFIRTSVLEIDEHFIREYHHHANHGYTPVFVAIDGEMASVVAIGDPLRPDALATIQKLQQRGWQIGILSGDHPETVKAIARALSIDDSGATGGLSPESKLEKIQSSRHAGQTTVMVGDGVNDAAALAAADVGIAIRGGAEASLQAAPIYLADGQLKSIVDLMDASQQTVKTIRRNFRVSLGYNSLAITLSVLGLINPLIAAILMPISSLSILSLTLASQTFRDEKSEAMT